VECGSSRIDANGTANAQIIGDGGFETLDERSKAETAGGE
jgi:hypothetical protein